jgi:hypothetical protein
MLRKIVLIILLFVVLFTAGYVLFVKYVPYSEGVRTGELIKFSNKGYVFKTYEGEISQGISGAMIFKFSVSEDKKDVIKMLNDNQGKYIKVNYEERYTTFPWWGDTNYYITEVKSEKSPHFGK